MPFTPKNWSDTPSTATPITAAALEDLETRVTDYTDDEVAGGVGGAPQNVYIQETEPVDPTIPSLWIPIDGLGVPLSTDQWQVYTEP